jgi:hypothetical protein
MTTTPFSIIKEMLWREFGYTLVVDPSYMTQKIITELENNGHKIVPFILNDNPNGMHARESSLSRAGLDG